MAVETVETACQEKHRLRHRHNPNKKSKTNC